MHKVGKFVTRLAFHRIGELFNESVVPAHRQYVKRRVDVRAFVDVTHQ